ncbi:eukaryotic translation initiation factor 2C, partial [Lecanoromycetidae sp. Uapishka_2]
MSDSPNKMPGAASKRRAAERNGGNGQAGPAAYDGPNDPPGRGRAGSNAGSNRSASRGPGSRSASQTREAQMQTARALQPPAKEITQLLKNVDFGGNAYGFTHHMPSQSMHRVGFGKAGKPAKIQINSHIVKSWPERPVFQYDVLIGSGVEKRGLVQRVWKSNAVKTAVGKGFIFDGNKIGWGPVDFKRELRVSVDLDAEDGRPPRGTPNIHRVVISNPKNKKINLAAIKGYLEGTTDFDISVLEAINFLDHLLRETPSKTLINLRRSYFSRTGESQDRKLLGGGIEAMKGVYQTIRMAEGKRLVINVDVSNSCFWHETRFDQLAYLLSGESSQLSFMNAALPPSGGGEPRLVKALRRLAKNKFTVKHRGQTNAEKTYTVKRIAAVNAKTHKFDVFEKDTGKTINMSCYDYFKKRYNVILEKWQLPLIETMKAGVLFPMELAHMQSGQKYPFKLNETQTAEMIKFAVSRPGIRRQAIEKGLDMLKWSEDPMLKGYGLSIDSEMLKTNARILEPPEVLFAKNMTAKPAFSGRWDLRGKVFFLPNTAPLKSWGICVLSPGEDRRAPVSRDQIEAFKKNFITLYRGHGGKVENTDPPIIGGVPDDAEAINTTFQAAGNQVKARPQMLLVILTNRNADVYNRIKRNCDCRFGVMSQCVQASNVVKNAPQYCSNVLMKFNCKLGGTTSTLKSKTKYFEEPTMIIGADVSHAAPGLEQASMAAMTMSIDRTASRYAAAVESNGSRVEMITSDNVNAMLGPMVDYWVKNVGGGNLPKHVYYFRDGVSEGQFIPLLQQEVADMKRLFAQLGHNHPGNKFTVVVAEKRHHIRFFPPTGAAADKNGNPLPGTIVDRDVTHPFENDIYLCSHVAIQGTARPTHYYMLMDEANVPVDRFQALLYDHCYQYQRATTPVSLFPAVYYAHLASKRGEAHIDMAANERAALQEERRKKGREAQSHSDETRSQTEWPKLQPFEPKNQMGLGMWYI